MGKLKMFQPALLLTVLCLIVTLMLAATYEITKDPIARQQQEAALMQKQEIFPEGKEFSNIVLSEAQIEAMAAKDIAAAEISAARDAGGNVIGYVFVTSSRGYAGNVVATTGIDTQGKVIMVRATAADDTPGLGKRVEEKGFQAQFSNLDTKVLTSVSAGSGTHKIDSISGATISSRAASSAVNKAMGAYSYLLEEGVIS
ncbi:MAG: RnfABCDGE type electron transport complex subunit G [Eubacteriales bacterium]